MRTLKRKFSVSTPTQSPLKLRDHRIVTEDCDISASCTERSIADEDLRHHRDEDKKRRREEESEREAGDDEDSASLTKSRSSRREFKRRKTNTPATTAEMLVSLSTSSLSTLSSPLKKLARSGSGANSVSLSVSMSMSVSMADEESRRLSRSASNESFGLVNSVAETELIDMPNSTQFTLL